MNIPRESTLCHHEICRLNFPTAMSFKHSLRLATWAVTESRSLPRFIIIHECTAHIDIARFSIKLITSKKQRLLQNHPRTGNILEGSTSCLHSGHSGFSLTQSLTQVQQNICPQVVTLGSLNGSRHNVHL